MDYKQFNLKEITQQINGCLHEYEIESETSAVNIEKEWIDFRITIKDLRQMGRIDVWLQDEVKAAVKGYSDIQISAPTPVAGKENELRVRIYG